MNRAELCEAIAKDMKTTKAEGDRFLASMLNCLTKGLKKDKTVQLVGFGTFSVKKRAARKGRNPQTGETIKIKASKTVGFKAGKGLKGKI
ncbi:MAG: HU family DNA-binding protein [Planctomycetota bacterium]|jgi:DNA-binding protein HU-beta